MRRATAQARVRRSGPLLTAPIPDLRSARPHPSRKAFLTLQRLRNPQTAKATSRGRSSSARFAEFPTKLFDKGASDQQIGKAPTITNLTLPGGNSTSILRLNVSRLVKLYYPPAQFDIQSVSSNGKLNDIRMFNLVRCRLLPRPGTICGRQAAQ